MDEDRKTVLLRAALELLKKCEEGPYVVHAPAVEVFYDDTMCDGACLANDIAILLDEPEPF